MNLERLVLLYNGFKNTPVVFWVINVSVNEMNCFFWENLFFEENV